MWYMFLIIWKKLKSGLYREREHEIMSKKAAIKLAGKKAVDMAIDYVAIQEQLKQMY